MTRNNSIPMLNKAGSEIIMAKSSFRIPLAAFMRRNTRPIRKTRTTRSKVGVMKISSKMSSNTMPGNIMSKIGGFVQICQISCSISVYEKAGVPCMTNFITNVELLMIKPTFY